MKPVLFSTVIALLVFTAGSAAWYAGKLHHANSATVITSPEISVANKIKEKLSIKAADAYAYAAANKFNTQFCFMADMGIASGKPRFFVYDMKKNAVLKTGLVTHGRCNQNWLVGRKYGNAVGCGCTSPGKYRIGNPYKGRFGLAYKLMGLEHTNSNAYNRFIVLHSMQCVPENAVDPYPICQSDGCPTVSPGFLKELAVIIDGSKQPILLWIYE